MTAAFVVVVLAGATAVDVFVLRKVVVVLAAAADDVVVAAGSCVTTANVIVVLAGAAAVDVVTLRKVVLLGTAVLPVPAPPQLQEDVIAYMFKMQAAQEYMLDAPTAHAGWQFALPTTCPHHAAIALDNPPVQTQLLAWQLAVDTAESAPALPNKKATNSKLHDDAMAQDTAKLTRIRTWLRATELWDLGWSRDSCGQTAVCRQQAAGVRKAAAGRRQAGRRQKAASSRQLSAAA